MAKTLTKFHLARLASSQCEKLIAVETACPIAGHIGSKEPRRLISRLN